MAKAEARNESLSHLWEECWSEQQLAQASLAESTQEAIIRQCGQCNDHGDTEGSGCTKNDQKRQRQPYFEAVFTSYR
jgi:hypothetical protein